MSGLEGFFLLVFIILDNSFMLSCCKILRNFCIDGKDGLRGRELVPASITGLSPHIIWKTDLELEGLGGADYDVARIIGKNMVFEIEFFEILKFCSKKTEIFNRFQTR